MKFFCLISMAASATIPLHFYSDGVSSFVNMYMGGPAIPFRPHLGPVFHFNVPRQEAGSWISRSNAHFEDSDITMVVPTVLNRTRTNEQGLQHWIGIGPSSRLVSLHNSVDFVRGPNGGRLMLGTSEERFIADHCLQNSCVRFQAQFYSLRDVITEATILEQRSEILFGDADYVLSLSPPVYVRIFGASKAHWDRRNGDGRPYTIENCGAHLASLPTITVSFETGDLVLSPEDYTRMIAGNVCEVLVNLDSRLPEIWTVHMNPFLIPNRNLRITNQEILICESREI